MSKTLLNSFYSELEKIAKTLTAKTRDEIPTEEFALPGRRYPIHDEAHARNALARISQYGSPAEQAAVRAAVHRKFPGIGEEGKEKEAWSIFRKKKAKHSKDPNDPAHYDEKFGPLLDIVRKAKVDAGLPANAQHVGGDVWFVPGPDKGMPKSAACKVRMRKGKAKTAGTHFLDQNRPESVKKIYRALKRDHPEMSAEMKARIAARQGKPGKQRQGPPYSAPLSGSSDRESERD